MADLHPTQGNVSPLRTSPPAQTTAIYRKQPQVFGQMGRATSYTSNGETFYISKKPTYYQLAAWDQARRKEPLIKQGLEYIILAVVSKIGPFSHPDNEIDDFVQANIEANLKQWISTFTESLLSFGFSVSEINWQRKLGPRSISQVWIDDLVDYHPMQVTLFPNDYGVIKDGDIVTGHQFKSGIYVPTPYTYKERPKNREYMGSLVRLPKYKRLYATFGSGGNNPWGHSLLETILPYHLFKEAYRDMWTTALDRYGTPLLYVIVPPLDTKEMIEEVGGDLRPKTLQEQAVEQLQNLSSESALVFTQISKDQPVQLGSLTTGNNFSDAFQSAIDMCDYNILHGLGIPNLLIKDQTSSLGSGGASERQLEMFDSFTSAIFDIAVGAFVNQVILQLIQFNFDAQKNPLAYHPGTIQKKPTKISELEAVVKSIKELTELGYINPANEIDFKHVRELVSLPARKPDPDTSFVLPENRIHRITVAEDNNKAPDVPNPAAKHVMETKKLDTQKEIAEENRKASIAKAKTTASKSKTKPKAK